MSVFGENIVNEIPVVEKVRFAIGEVLDEVTDLVNNHFGDCQLNIVGTGRYQTLLPPNTAMSFVRESGDKLKALCGSDFGHKYGLLIVKPVILETIVSEPINKTDSTTTYKVKVHAECFIDESTIPSTGAAMLYSDMDFFYTKTIYNQPHWP